MQNQYLASLRARAENDLETARAELERHEREAERLKKRVPELEEALLGLQALVHVARRPETRRSETRLDVRKAEQALRQLSGPITSASVAATLGVSVRSARAVLLRLVREGKLETAGVKKDGPGRPLQLYRWKPTGPVHPPNPPTLSEAQAAWDAQQQREIERAVVPPSRARGPIAGTGHDPLRAINNPDLRALAERALDAGWHAEKLSGGHVRLRHPTVKKRSVVLPTTSRAPRVVANMKSLLRKEGLL